MKKITINQELRYIVIDEITGEILDNAQGYGFKTYNNALKSYNFKKKFNIKNIKNIKNEAKNLFKKYKELEIIFDEINYDIYYSYKDGLDMNKKEIDNLKIKEIKSRIPELYSILEQNNDLKYQLLKL